MSESIGAELATTFGTNQKNFRLARGWSQSELARQMQEAGWPKYSQVAVSRTEDGERIVRLDEAIAISRVLETTLNLMIAPPESHVAWIQEMQQQSQLVIDASKHLSDAARSYESTRQTALHKMEWISRKAESKKAVRSLRDSLTRELEQLSALASQDAWDLLNWLVDEQARLDDEKFTDEA